MDKPVPIEPFAPYCVLSMASSLWGRKFMQPVEDVTAEYVTELDPAVDLKFYERRLEEAWARETQKKKPSFFRALASVFWRIYVCYMAPFVLMTFAQLGISITISFFEEALRPSQDSNSLAYGLAALYSILSLFSVWMLEYGFTKSDVLGCLIQISIASVLFRKSLELSPLQSKRVSRKILNLVAAETDILILLPMTWFLFVTPLLIVASIPVLYFLVGPSGLAALAFVLLLVPAKLFMAKYIFGLRSKVTNLSEIRLQAIQSIIEGIKSIKMLAWERTLVNEIEAVKQSELKQNSRMNVLRNFDTTFGFAGGLLVMLVLLLVHTGLGNEVKSGEIFAACTVLFTVNTWVNSNMSFAVDVATWCNTLFQKITEIMVVQEETDNRKMLQGDCAFDVVCEEVSAGWVTSPPHQSTSSTKAVLEPAANIVLRNISIHIPRGELVIAIGKVGSGRSSMLSLLAGVLQSQSGSVGINHSFAFVEGEPWIVTGSVRDNITMGESFDEDFFGRVIDMCCLASDIESMPEKDLTLIGDRGSTLSGGQKARIALARAVYRNRQVYLLDDPLSAVDSYVASHIFSHCISSGLQGKTRVLITNQHQFLPQADRILVFHEGRIALQGTYETIKNNPVFLSVSESISIRETCKKPPALDHPQIETLATEHCEKVVEDDEQDSVPISMYWKYLLLYFRSWWALLAFVALAGVMHAVYLGATYWVSYWASKSVDEQGDILFPSVLGGIVAAAILLCVCRTSILFDCISVSNMRLHNLALNGIANTQLSFFDTNPQGRILSRFSKDISVMEEQFVRYFGDLTMYTGLLLSYMVALVVILPYNLAVMAVVFVLGFFAVKKLLPSTRKFKRVELGFKEELISLLTSVLSGSAVIRTLNFEEFFRKKFAESASLFFQANFCYVANDHAFKNSITILGMLYITVNAFTSVIVKGSMSTDVLAANISFVGMLTFCMGTFAKFYQVSGSLMVSGHRLFEYSQLPKETDKESNRKLKIAEGKIEYRNVYLKYAEHLEFALCQLSFTVAGGSKLGIVGRTGSGKSSIVLALFRLKKLASGSILIDGQDISSVSLASLRSQLSVIPQSPVLFAGSVEANLDPTHSFSSDCKAAVLSQLSLSSEALKEAGTLSAGQKQLLCLARAFLRDSQIVVFDEATGNIDPRTQDFLLKLLQQQLVSKTVISIAHRLKTVMGCDQVVVVADGTVLERGNPQQLAETEGSHFRGLMQAAKDTGVIE